MIPRTFRYALMVTAVLPALVLGGTSAHAETMQEAVIAAIQAHPQIEEALAAQKAARETVREERSEYFPKLSASAAGGRTFSNNSTSRGLSVTRGEGYSWLWEGSFGINQLIFDGLKTIYNIDSAEFREKAAAYKLRDVQETLALQTALSYINILRTQSSLEKLKAYHTKIIDYKGRISSMVKEGAADEAELQQADQIDLEIQNLVAGFEGEYQIALAEFARLSGRASDGNVVRPPNAAGLPAKTEAVSMAQAAHPALKSASEEINAADKMASAEKAVLYPTLSGELSTYKKDLDDIIGGEVEDQRALLRMNWEFSTGGAELARIKRAKYDRQQSEARLDQTKRAVENTLNIAYAEMESSERQKAILQERVTLNKNLLGTYNQQFEGGKVRILQLLQAENQLLSAELEYLNADFRNLSAQYSALAGMGYFLESMKGSVAPVQRAPQPVEEEAGKKT